MNSLYRLSRSNACVRKRSKDDGDDDRRERGREMNVRRHWTRRRPARLVCLADFVSLVAYTASDVLLRNIVPAPRSRVYENTRFVDFDKGRKGSDEGEFRRRGQIAAAFAALIG